MHILSDASQKANISADSIMFSISMNADTICTTQKQPSCIKRVRLSKSLGEKSCEIKGSGHEMAVMMWYFIIERSHACIPILVPKLTQLS